jgi:hypothetical protein
MVTFSDPDYNLWRSVKVILIFLKTNEFMCLTDKVRFAALRYEVFQKIPEKESGKADLFIFHI